MKNKNLSSYHHGNLKDALIQTSLEMIESDGLGSITLRELTKRLGTSRSAVYRHYDSKDILIKAVIQAGFEKLDKQIKPTLLEGDDVLHKLYSMGKAYINFAINNPNLYRSIFGHELMNEREESCDINDFDSDTGFHVLVAVMIEGHENNIIKKEDPILQATVIWSMIHGISNLLIDGHIHVQKNIDILYELSFKTLIHGMQN